MGGREARFNQQEKKSKPWRMVKAIVGIITAPIWLFFAAFSYCYIENKWPWE